MKPGFRLSALSRIILVRIVDTDYLSAESVEKMNERESVKNQTIKKIRLTHQAELVERIGWLIRVRWLAAIGVSSTILVATCLFDLLIDRNQLLLISSAIPVCNIIYYFYFKWLLKRKQLPTWDRRVALLANAQISVDLIILITLVYISGGAENPFFFYFIFHMIIASILLSNTASYLQATLAVLLFNLMLLFEGLGLLPHNRLFPFFEETVYRNPVFLIGLSAVFTSTIYLSVYMATSITRRLRMREEELIQLKDSLEETNRELREVHDYRSRFILKVEHELKAPLAAIESLIVVILTSFAETLTPKVKELLSRAEKRSYVLLEMIRELLELSRMQTADYRFELKPLSLESMLGRLLEILRSQAEDKSLSLETKLPGGLPKVLGDKKAIEQVMMNLLSNSLKYTESGGVIVEAELEDGFVKVIVADTGIGMSEEELQMIFEEFFRGEHAKEKYEGTGLGLSIVKEIVIGHGGRIEVESTPGKGSKFTVWLPAAK